MPLNKSKGNMYGFITHTWNLIKGVCPHNCRYCYMRKWWPNMSAPRLAEEELNYDPGTGKYIFVGSGIDMFANEINHNWIDYVITKCNQSNNTYLFQSKNPERFQEFNYPKNTIFCTTIETNERIDKRIIGNCPQPIERKCFFSNLIHKKMITIEPVMDFDIDIFLQWIREIDPVQINIGADTGRNNLPEPSPDKLNRFIKALRDSGLKIHLKNNLKRLLSG